MEAPLDSQVARGGHVHVHETRHDLHLRRPRVEAPDHRLRLIQAVLDIRDQQRVRALVDFDVPALRERLLERLGHLLGVRVAHGDDARHERQELLLVPLGGAFLHLFLAERLEIRHDDGLPLLHLAEALGAEQDVQGMPPRHVTEPERDLPLHFLARDDVLAAELGEAAEHRLDLGALHVERHAAAVRCVADVRAHLPRALRDAPAVGAGGRGRLRRGPLDREDEAVPELAHAVGRGLRQIDDDPRARLLAPAHLGCPDGLHGRALTSRPGALRERERGARAVEHDAIRRLEGEVVVVDRGVRFHQHLGPLGSVLERDALDRRPQGRNRAQEKQRQERRRGAPPATRAPTASFESHSGHPLSVSV